MNNNDKVREALVEKGYASKDGTYVQISMRELLDILNNLDPWQPIETAPKDGVNILLYCPANKYDQAPTQIIASREIIDGVSFWQVGRDSKSNEPMICTDNFTHWQPLPAPPKGKK